MGHGVQGHTRRSLLDAATATQVAQTMQALARRVQIIVRLVSALD